MGLFSPPSFGPGCAGGLSLLGGFRLSGVLSAAQGFDLLGFGLQAVGLGFFFGKALLLFSDGPQATGFGLVRWWIERWASCRRLWASGCWFGSCPSAWRSSLSAGRRAAAFGVCSLAGLRGGSPLRGGGLVFFCKAFLRLGQ
ncbi:hypothetical protein OIU84_024277 [Salix udensis]|uniref:Uncharacterized protein n=1 Tax=Salix udensis TaxID=889485 RepID=A0AAD6KHG7_9ROSI|nr:hypothetical protein OIU84_024277 [Salix udensis]